MAALAEAILHPVELTVQRALAIPEVPVATDPLLKEVAVVVAQAARVEVEVTEAEGLEELAAFSASTKEME